jgi:hypothetical protein
MELTVTALRSQCARCLQMLTGPSVCAPRVLCSSSVAYGTNHYILPPLFARSAPAIGERYQIQSCTVFAQLTTRNAFAAACTPTYTVHCFICQHVHDQSMNKFSVRVSHKFLCRGLRAFLRFNTPPFILQQGGEVQALQEEDRASMLECRCNISTHIRY